MKTNSLKVNATLNAIKQLCGIIFPIISFSYASRVVGAEGIGVYSFAQSIVSYILLLASIGVTNYAVREGSKIKDDKEKLNQFCNQVYSINLLFTIFAYLVLAILMITWTRLQDYKVAILIQSVAVILTTLGADWINTIYEDYLFLTIRYIIIQALSLLAMFLFVKTPSDLYIYIVICVLSSVGGNIFNIFYIRRRVKLKFTFTMNFKHHILPLIILFFNSVASVVYLNSDITMLKVFTNDTEVGIYTVSTKVYSSLKTLINGITYVTVPRFSYYLGKNMSKEYTQKYQGLVSALITMTFPVSVGVFMLSNDILSLFAGPGYESGQMVIQLLAIAFPFAVGSCLFSYAVLIPNGLEKLFMISTLIAAATNVLLNLFLIPLMGMNSAALTTIIAEIIVFCITYFCARRITGKMFSLKVVGSAIVGSVLVGIIC